MYAIRSYYDTQEYIKKKFAKSELIVQANLKVLDDGYNYGSILQVVTPSFHISPADVKKGTYRNLSGNTAVAWGFLAARNNFV